MASGRRRLVGQGLSVSPGMAPLDGG